jgi:hypothetical protein
MRRYFAATCLILSDPVWIYLELGENTSRTRSPRELRRQELVENAHGHCGGRRVLAHETP